MTFVKSTTFKAILHSALWTFCTALFAFGVEYLSKFIFLFLHELIKDSTTLNSIISKSNSILAASKLFHYTLIILSALTVEFILHIFKFRNGSIILKIFSVFLLIVLFIYTFYRQTIFQIHESESTRIKINDLLIEYETTCKFNINNFAGHIKHIDSNDKCQLFALSLLITALTITFLIRSYIYSIQYNNE